MSGFGLSPVFSPDKCCVPSLAKPKPGMQYADEGKEVLASEGLLSFRKPHSSVPFLVLFVA